MKKLEGKTIIVVGASGGIGRVFCRVFYDSGANVVLSARNEERLNKLKMSLGGERVLVAPTDATFVPDTKAMFEAACNRFGSVDAVVISAGTWRELSVKNATDEALNSSDELYHSIFLPSFVVGFAAQKFFRKQARGGLIINISSHAAIKPELPRNLTYGPFKAAARHFMLALRHELAGAKIRVTDIEPAIVNTPENSFLLNTEEKRKKAVQPEVIAEWIIEHFDDPDIPAEKLFDSDVVV